MTLPEDSHPFNPNSIRSALKSWHSLPELGRHPLAQCNIVEKHQASNYPNILEERGRALRDILRDAIRALGPDDEDPPNDEDNPKFLDRRWRFYIIFTQQYINRRTPKYVAEQLGIALRTYFDEQARALDLLVDILRQREEAFRPVPPPSEPPDRGSMIRQCEANLMIAGEADISAKQLGDIAIAHNDEGVLRALWRVICQTNHLLAIIDPCAYTIGRIVWETPDPRLEEVGFDIFDESTRTKSEAIVDRFAHIVGEVIFQTKKDKTRQRAWQFVNINAMSPDPLIRDKYTFTKNRIARLLTDYGHDLE